MDLSIPVESSESKTKELSPDDLREPYSFRLPTELLLEIMTLLWDSAISEQERRGLKNILPLVCQTIAAVFYRVSQQEVRITSPEFYDYYIGRVSQLDRSHPMNTCCKTFRFHLGRMMPPLRVSESAQALEAVMKAPLDMGSQWDSLECFNKGKDFVSKGLFPNLTNLLIYISGRSTEDPYHVIHINYLIPPDILYRRTPIRYPSNPHKLKTLTVTGIREKIDIARLWESLFDVEEFIVDGKVLPVGECEDIPWGLDVKQACDMIELGHKGIGWNWLLGRPWDPLDEHSYWIWSVIYLRSIPDFLKEKFARGWWWRSFRILYRWATYLQQLLSLFHKWIDRYAVSKASHIQCHIGFMCRLEELRAARF